MPDCNNLCTKSNKLQPQQCWYLWFLEQITQDWAVEGTINKWIVFAKAVRIHLSLYKTINLRNKWVYRHFSTGTRAVAFCLHVQIVINLFTWGDDKREARDRGRLGDFASGGPGFLWGLQLVGDASGRPSPERWPGAGAVAPETNAAQVGNHPIYDQEAKSVSSCVANAIRWARR